MDGKRNWTKIITSALLAIVGFVFLFYTMRHNLMCSPLWGDEWVEYHYSQKTILNGDMYRACVSTFQPPLYNWLAHFWLLIRQDITWFRELNVVLGIMIGALIFATNRKLTNAYVASISLIVLACIYQWVYCIQECSEYTLMLLGTSMLIYSYILLGEKYSQCRLLFFLISGIIAIYSQYGAAFIVLPLYITELVLLVKKSQISTKTKWVIFGEYAGFGAVFGIPLLYYYLLPQMGKQQNKVEVHRSISETLAAFKEIPTTIYSMEKYFLGFDSADENEHFLLVALLVILLICAGLLLVRRTEKYKKGLLIATFAAFFLHFIATEMGYYGENAGFLFRYSYFYIPIMAIVIPMVEIEAIRGWKGEMARPIGTALLIFILLISGIELKTSYDKVEQNWLKTHDREIAQEWTARQAWNVQTYLIEYAADQFEQYVPIYMEESGQDSIDFRQNLEYATNSGDIDYSQLPDTFYVWQTNWPREVGINLLWYCIDQGYRVEDVMYFDGGYGGRLTLVNKQ